MAITSAKYISKDNWRVEYVEDGETKHMKSTDPGFPALQASVPIDPYVETPKSGMEYQERITAKFWQKVADHFNVPVTRAQTHVGVMGAPAAVQTLWQKATALMDNPSLTKADIDNEGNW